MRYQVVRTFETDGDDVHEALARVADVDGLFAEARLPARREIVLRDCPDVALLSGGFVIEVLDDREQVRWWDVIDPVVQDVLPDGVVVSAFLCLQEERPQDLEPPEQPRYRIFQRDRFVGWCRDVEGLPGSWPGYSWPPVTLIGCDDPERIAELRWPPVHYYLWTGLQALDDTGRVMAEVRLDLDVSEVRPSGGGLFDVVLDQSRAHHLPVWRERPTPAARPVWDVWRRGLPQDRNLWQHLDSDGRQAWLDLTYVGHESRRPPDRSGGTYHLDGRHVTDLPGLQLALSEAFVGPGNYFGRGYDSFRDCLGGGWGVVAAGSTLVWHDARVAHDAICESFLDIVGLLRRYGMTVEIDSTVDGLTDLDRRTALGELVKRWKPGWVKAGGRNYWRILTDDSPREVDTAATQLMVSSSTDWLAVPTHSAVEVTETLERHGMELWPQVTFLRRDLSGHPMPPAPKGYEVEVTRDDVITVVVRGPGWVSVRGEIAVAGADAVPHHLNVAPNLRELGGVLLGVLAREAMADGATTGLVFAPDHDVELYRELGWETVAVVVHAMNDVWRKDLKRRSALGNLVRRWQKGWGAAERLPRPPESHSALRVRLDKGHHFILTDDGGALFHLKELALSDWQDVTLVIPTHTRRPAIERAQELGLRLLPPQKLMTRTLADHPAPEPPSGYVLTVTRTHVIETRITHDDVEVARGRMSVVDQDAVALDLGTDPVHRRRGLGSAMLGALVREAEKDGATTGLLFSSEIGLVFFRSLGWQDEADVVTVRKV